MSSSSHRRFLQNYNYVATLSREQLISLVMTCGEMYPSFTTNAINKHKKNMELMKAEAVKGVNETADIFKKLKDSHLSNLTGGMVVPPQTTIIGDNRQQNANLQYTSEGITGTSLYRTPTPEDINKFKALLKTGASIGAIKLHREITGMGLKESKDVIDSLKASMTPEELRQIN